uniref:EF-hand domain-containing protein n=1 Tax=Leptobrachium leishanense TaxID=445787 RepID=A0A8C5LPG6_9ANUR
TADKKWKTLRRAFRKLDMDSSGYLSLPEFRSVLKLCNFVLDEDEVYHIMSKYDQNMDGQQIICLAFKMCATFIMRA